MKTLKFRAWDSFNAEMMYSKENLLGKFFTDVEQLNIAGNNLIIQQFIDLNDSKGKPIYDGDVLFRLSFDKKGYWYKVFRVKGGFAINTHQSDFPKDEIVWYDSTADMQNASFISGSCEVIGNIYEGYKVED